MKGFNSFPSSRSEDQDPYAQELAAEDAQSLDGEPQRPDTSRFLSLGSKENEPGEPSSGTDQMSPRAQRSSTGTPPMSLKAASKHAPRRTPEEQLLWDIFGDDGLNN